MSAFLMLLYLWACFLFGLWYFYNRTLAKTSDNSERCLNSFLVSLFMSWWYWPLMIVYLVQDAREEKRKEIETIKRRAG